MKTKRTLPLTGKLNAAALVASAAGIVVQKLSGVAEFPLIPPGAVMLLGAAAFVTLGARWHWTSIVGFVVPAYLLTAAFVVSSGVWDRLVTPGEIGPFAGSALQMASMVAAVLTGAVALWTTYTDRRSAGIYQRT
ncbi:hypothetical protein ACH347_34330 [Saccharopolyspora sp. 5N102]|uniref:hypothetical protein n=1 Tax=Saccharopolyspora sp. 5N102 TaxID=3375155 RepID=UPI0037AD49C3